jgi:hypothetical protein
MDTQKNDSHILLKNTDTVVVNGQRTQVHSAVIIKLPTAATEYLCLTKNTCFLH